MLSPHKRLGAYLFLVTLSACPLIVNIKGGSGVNSSGKLNTWIGVPVKGPSVLVVTLVTDLFREGVYRRTIILRLIFFWWVKFQFAGRANFRGGQMWPAGSHLRTPGWQIRSTCQCYRQLAYLLLWQISKQLTRAASVEANQPLRNSLPSVLWI